jgi:hypothetical protein
MRLLEVPSSEDQMDIPQGENLSIIQVQGHQHHDRYPCLDHLSIYTNIILYSVKYKAWMRFEMCINQISTRNKLQEKEDKLPHSLRLIPSTCTVLRRLDSNHNTQLLNLIHDHADLLVGESTSGRPSGKQSVWRYVNRGAATPEKELCILS